MEQQPPFLVTVSELEWIVPMTQTDTVFFKQFKPLATPLTYGAIR